MAEHRHFPPSPRRRALARQAGLHAASPYVVGAAAGAALLVALGALGQTLVHRLGAAIAAACRGHAALTPAELPETVIAIALPVAGAAAIAALIAHLAQTRAVWLPRRRIADAPALESGPLPRVRRATGELAAAVVIGGVAFAWLWWAAPRIAVLVTLEPVASVAPIAPSPTVSRLLVGTATLLTRLAALLVVAWAALGLCDALVRRAALARALAMTAAEKHGRAN